MTFKRLVALTLLLPLLAGALAGPSLAQRYDNRYDRYDNDNQRGGRNVPGEFDYYALVLSWSPTHCSTRQQGQDVSQCERRDGRRYNFVLHGLWPQYERGFPGDCDIGKRPFVPDRVIDEAMDVMPSKPLIIHEYRKHGTCSGMEPQRYFEVAERLYRTIRIPQRYMNPFEQQTVSPEQLADEFLAENRQLKRDMFVVVCDGSRNRLKEVRICMNKEGQPRSCGRNENQRRLCSAANVFVPPVRSSSEARTDGPGAGHDRQQRRSGDGQQPEWDQRRGGNPLPMPRMERFERDERAL